MKARSTGGRRGWMVRLAVAIGASGIALASTSLEAQIGPFGRSSSVTTDVFRPAPRVLQQRISRARRAIERTDYAEAVELLGGILSGQVSDPDAADVSQDFFIVKPGSAEKVRTSLRAMALRLLTDLPPQGREFYELKFGSESRQLVKQAVAQRDLNQLQEVARRFLHTEAGYDAAFLAGEWQLQQGHPLAAALTLKRLYDIPYARQRFEPTLSLLLTTSYWQAGLTDQAVATVVALRAARRNAPLQLGGKSINWFSSDKPEEVVAWLRSNLGIDTRDGELYQTEWVLFRGDPKRNGMAAGDFPLMHFRWRVRTVLLHKHMEFIDSQREKFLAAGKALIPISQPLVVGDVVLMRSPERVLGVDLRTGKRIWDYPWFQDSIEFQADQTSFESYGKSDAERDELTQRLWEDAPYGQLSSDGERVYLLDELEPAPTSAYPQNVFMPRARGQASDERRHNQLVACRLAEEGKLKWIVGGATGVDEPQLAGAFFLGPPLPLMGDLFALAEIQGEIRLVVLDAATGKLKWFQQVAHVAELTIDVDRTRRLAGAVPSFDDGVLICPTAAGACVAIDLATRSFLWGYQYNSSRFVRRYGHVRQQSAADRWLDGTAVISDGCVVLTPVDSNQLHCLDLLTGQRKWPPLLREKLLFVGGVYDGVIFVVGEDVCRGIRLADGKPAWEDDLALGTSRPSGRGFLSGAFYYLPTTDHKLLKIDIRTGEVVQESTTDRPLGNLVAYRDQIISYDADQLGCYYQVEALRQLVEKRLKKSPDDHWALLHRAELLLHDGKQTEALADLRRAHKLAPDDTMTRQVLVSTLMEALRTDYKTHRALASEVVKLIEHPEQRRQYLQLLIDGSIKEKSWDTAWESVRQLIELTTSDPIDGGLGSSNNLTKIAPGHSVQLDRWIAARVQQIVRNTPADFRKQVLAHLKRSFEQQAGRADTAAMERACRLFGTLEEAWPVRLALARTIVKSEGDLLAAELWISDLVDPGSTAPDEMIAAALELQAEILHAAGHDREIAPLMERLAAEFSQIPVDGDRTGGDVARAWLEKIAQHIVPPHWPGGQLKVDEKKQGATRMGSTLQSYRLAVAQRTGDVTEGTAVTYDVGARQVRVMGPWGNRLAGQQVRTFFSIVGALPQQARLRGHLVMAPAGFDLFMFRTLRSSKSDDGGSLLWSRSVAPALLTSRPTFRSLGSETVRGEWGGARYRAIDRSNNQQPIGETGPITPFGVVYQKMQELICVDPISGEVLWRRTGFPAGAELSGDDERLFVTGRNSQETIVVRMLDGDIIETRPCPPDAQRWRWFGRDLLRCRTTKKGIELSRWDIDADRPLWQHDYPAKTRFTLVGDQHIAALTPKGDLTIVSGTSGNVVVASKVTMPVQFEGLYVLISREDFLVVVNGTVSNAGNVVYEKLPMRNGALLYARIYSFDRKTGKPRWAKPAMVAGYGLSFDQPSDLPILVFTRRTRNRAALRTPGRTNQYSIMCLDRRYGSIALPERKLIRAPTSYRIQGDPLGGTVTLSVPQFEFVFRLMDTPFEKTPEPVQMKLRSEVRMSATLEGLSRIAEGLFKSVEGNEKKKKDEKKKDKEKAKRDPFAPATEKKEPKKK